MLTFCVPCPEDAAFLLENAWRVLKWVGMDHFSLGACGCVQVCCDGKYLETVDENNCWLHLTVVFPCIFVCRLPLSVILVLLTVKNIVYYSVGVNLYLNYRFLSMFICIYFVHTCIRTFIHPVKCIYTSILLDTQKHVYTCIHTLTESCFRMQQEKIKPAKCMQRYRCSHFFFLQNVWNFENWNINLHFNQVTPFFQ